MLLNVSKTKEIVFHKPNPRNYLSPVKLTNIDRVSAFKLLGVVFNDNLKFSDHVTSLISQCNQRLYLLRQPKLQGLGINKLDVVFNAIVVSKLSYALPAWGGFISAHLANSINSMFKKSFKYQLTSKVFTVENLLIERDKTLFNKASRDQSHCLFHLFPEKRGYTYNLRGRGHEFSVPNISGEVFKNSFINRTLFNFIK